MDIKKEVRFSFADIDGDKSPEVFLEIYENGETIYSAYAASSKGDGVYDTVEARIDADGDGDVDRQDDELFIDLVGKIVKLAK